MISGAWHGKQYISNLAHQHPKLSVFALPILGAKHHIIIAPSLTDQLLRSPEITNKVSQQPQFFSLMETVFGDHEGRFRTMDQNILWRNVEGALAGLDNEESLNLAMEDLKRSLGADVGRLISLGTDGTKGIWEKASAVTLLDGKGLSATASLYPLLRDFTAKLVFDTLLGPDFLLNYPDALLDLFMLDYKLDLLQTGMPTSFPALVAAHEARTRLLENLQAHHVVYMEYRVGEDAGLLWQDIHKASRVIGERIEAFAKAGDFDKDKPSTERGMLSAMSTLYMLWQIWAIVVPTTFWMVYHVYSDPPLLSELREEVAFCIKQGDSLYNNIDISPLQANCPLLKAILNEALRSESHSIIYRYIYKNFTMAEFKEDARTLGHECPQTYIFKAGEFIRMPLAVHQKDDRYFDNADQFNARRTPAYETSPIWEASSVLRHGAKLAEAQILAVVAATIVAWDVVRVDGDGKERPWSPHPGHTSGAGAVMPDKDVRVKLSKRGLSKES